MERFDRHDASAVQVILMGKKRTGNTHDRAHSPCPLETLKSFTVKDFAHPLGHWTTQKLRMRNFSMRLVRAGIPTSYSPSKWPLGREGGRTIVGVHLVQIVHPERFAPSVGALDKTHPSRHSPRD